VPRSTEKDKAPSGYMTPRAAAELLGRSDQTIRNLVKDDKVGGTEVVTENGERRYYISREAVENLLAQTPVEIQGPPPHQALPERLDLVERYISSLETYNEALVRVLQEMREQSTRTNERLTTLNQSTQNAYSRERRLLRLTLIIVITALLFSDLLESAIHALGV
jgi:excisionase family DNA binding protein